MNALIFITFPVCFFVMSIWAYMGYGGNSVPLLSFGIIIFFLLVFLERKKVIPSKLLKVSKLAYAAGCLVLAIYFHFGMQDFLLPKILAGMSCMLLIATSLEKKVPCFRKDPKTEEKDTETCLLSPTHLFFGLLLGSTLVYFAGLKTFSIILFVLTLLYGIFLATNKKALAEANGEATGETS